MRTDSKPAASEGDDDEFSHARPVVTSNLNISRATGHRGGGIKAAEVNRSAITGDASAKVCLTECSEEVRICSESTRGDNGIRLLFAAI